MLVKFSVLTIDGSYGEGGGQILRTAVALSAISGTSVQIFNIRGKRERPGLRPQHVAAVQAAAQICKAEVTGALVGSNELTFTPSGEIAGGDYEFDIGTAGSTTLVAQTVLAPLSTASEESTVTIRGGTHNPMAPTSDYLEHVFEPAARLAGLQAGISTERFGFDPKGGGVLHLRISPTEFRALHSSASHTNGTITIFSANSGLPQSLFTRIESRALELLPGRKVEFVHQSKGSIGEGIALTLVVTTDELAAGFSALGRKGKPMERVVDEAIGLFLNWEKEGGGIDEHLADQLVLPTILAREKSLFKVSRVSEHLRTVLWLAGEFLPIHFSIDEVGKTIAIYP